MILDRLKEEFNSLKNLFDESKEQIEKNVVRVESYKGEFYEITPYSYQRTGFKQGTIVKNTETYFYEDNFLQKIVIKQFDRNEVEQATLQHSFNYKPNGELNSITLTTELYSETIYQEK